MITDRHLDISATFSNRQLLRKINLCRHLTFGNRLGSAHESMPESVEIAQLTSQNFAYRGLGQFLSKYH